MGQNQRNLYGELRKRSEKTERRRPKYQELLKPPTSLGPLLTESFLQSLHNATTWQDRIVVIGFHGLAALAGIGLGIVVLWTMGYLVLLISSSSSR